MLNMDSPSMYPHGFPAYSPLNRVETGLGDNAILLDGLEDFKEGRRIPSEARWAWGEVEAGEVGSSWMRTLPRRHVSLCPIPGFISPVGPREARAGPMRTITYDQRMVL